MLAYKCDGSARVEPEVVGSGDGLMEEGGEEEEDAVVKGYHCYFQVLDLDFEFVMLLCRIDWGRL